MPGEFTVFTYDAEPKGYCHGYFPTIEKCREIVTTLGTDQYEIKKGELVIEACFAPKAGAAQ